MKKTPIHLIGKKFNLLKIIGIDEYRNGHHIVTAICDCGKQTHVRSSSVINGHAKSCGCLIGKNDGSSARTHGMSDMPIYNVWFAMLQRCRNSSNKNYKLYGARGITVCKRWNEFSNFLYDMGTPPTHCKMTLDRIDNNKGYSPDNCRWATYSQQVNNRRNTIRVEFKGETQTLIEWSKSTGLPYDVLYYRIRLCGWSVDRALTAPLGGRCE